MIVAHLADSHIAPQGDLRDPVTGLNARLMDRYRCTRFCVTDALARGAELILHAGDLLNSARPTPTEGRLARQALQPAIDAGVPVVLILGNHEAGGAQANHALEWLKSWPGVTVIDQPCLLDVWRDADNAGPLQVLAYSETPPAGVYCPQRHIQIACLPWQERRELLTDPVNRQKSPAELNLLMREVVMERLWALAEQRTEGVPCVLLAHAAVEEADLGSGVGALGTDWTLTRGELASLGFDTVLLGHYHQPQVLHSEPPIAYCGSPEACAFGEEGQEKVYHLLAIGADGVRMEPIATPFRRLVTLGPEDFDEEGALRAPHAMVSELSGAIVRLRLPQVIGDRQRAMTATLEQSGAVEVRVEIERAEVQARRETGVSSEMSAAQALDAWLEQKPDLKPLRDELQEAAAQVEAAMQGGAS